jgi:hypothetical protein
MSVQFDPFSRQIGFNYRNEPTRFPAPARTVFTKRVNGLGAKLYSNYGVTKNMNKKRFYTEGAFRGPPTKKNKAFAKFQAEQEGLVRMRGNDPVGWAKNFHDMVLLNRNNNETNTNNDSITKNKNKNTNKNKNNNLQTPNSRSLCQKVCNAVGRCFCLRKGGKTMKKRKQS